MGATSYVIQLSTSSNFEDAVPGYFNLNVGNVMSYAFTGLTPSTTYYLRVRAHNATGDAVGYSNSVSTVTLLTAPVGWAITDWTNGTIDFGSATPDLLTEFETSNASDFTSVVENGIIDQPSYQTSGLFEGTEYWIRVRQVDNSGGYSEWVVVGHRRTEPTTPTYTSINVSGFELSGDDPSFGGALINGQYDWNGVIWQSATGSGWHIQWANSRWEFAYNETVVASTVYHIDSNPYTDEFAYFTAIGTVFYIS